MLALVVGTYGWPPAGLFATPWREFTLLWRNLGRVREWRTVQDAQGVGFGIGLALNGRDGSTLRTLTEMEGRALRDES